MRFPVRTALVTGASRGLGLEVCRQLGARGLHIILTARDRDRGERGAARLRAGGTDVRFELLDVCDQPAVARCAERLRADGVHVDVLVNNAGIYPTGPALKMTTETLREVRGDVKVNVVCPGWVRTRMGGPGATVSVEDGAETIVWLANLPPGGPNGGFFRERRRIPW